MPIDGFLNTSYFQMNYGIPITIIEIVKNDFFPVKFKYKEEGYQNLIFSERLSNVIYTDTSS